MSQAEYLIDMHLPPHGVGSPEGRHVDAGLSRYGRPEIVLALQDLNVEPVFSRGASAYDHARGEARVLEPTLTRRDRGWEVAVTPRVESISAISAIHNTAAHPLGHRLPELNRPDVRQLVRDRNRLDVILAEAGGSLGYGPAWCDPRRIKSSEHFALQAERPDQVTQLAAANDCGKLVLRTAVFGHDDDENMRVITAHAARVSRSHGRSLPKHVVYVKPDSPDIAAADKATQALYTSLLRHTSAEELQFAVEWRRVAGPQNATGRGILVPVMIDTQAPLITGSLENPEFVQRQAGLLAAQLARMAVRRSQASPQ